MFFDQTCVQLGSLGLWPGIRRGSEQQGKKVIENIKICAFRVKMTKFSPLYSFIIHLLNAIEEV